MRFASAAADRLQRQRTDGSEATMFSTTSIDSVTLEAFDASVPFAKTVFGARARRASSPAGDTLDEHAGGSRRSVSGMAIDALPSVTPGKSARS
jgi:hypothetical protein